MVKSTANDTTRQCLHDNFFDVRIHGRHNNNSRSRVPHQQIKIQGSATPATLLHHMAESKLQSGVHRSTDGHLDGLQIENIMGTRSSRADSNKRNCLQHGTVCNETNMETALYHSNSRICLHMPTTFTDRLLQRRWSSVEMRDILLRPNIS